MSKKNQERYALTVSLDEELYDRIKKMAYDDDRTMASMLRLLVKRQLKQADSPANPPAVRKQDLPPIT